MNKDANYGSDCRSDVPQDQSYMNMSDVSGQDPVAAADDMLKAMLTPGGMLKKVADSVTDSEDDDPAEKGEY